MTAHPVNEAVPAAMAGAVSALLDSLGADQRVAASMAFDDPGRMAWHYTPRRRSGVSWAEMDRSPAKATHRLLATVLSPSAHARVAAIAGLEDVLDEMEGGRRGRHAGDYWVAVFGRPGDEHWGWRFEGHHVSVNVTVAGAQVSTTPLFLGANPARVAEDGRTVLRPLGPEEDLAWELLASLDAGQRARAVIDDVAPADIVTGERTRAGVVLGAPAGLAGADLKAPQRHALRTLAATYANRLVPPLARPALGRLDDHLDSLHFAWAGEEQTGRGHPHYYRLHGPGFLVELDNTQHGANHVHSVWRDPEGDFGAALVEIPGSAGRSGAGGR